MPLGDVVGAAVGLELVDSEDGLGHVEPQPFDVEQAHRALGVGLGDLEPPPTPLVVDPDLADALGSGLLEGAHLGDRSVLGERGDELVGGAAGRVGNAAMERLDAEGVVGKEHGQGAAERFFVAPLGAGDRRGRPVVAIGDVDGGLGEGGSDHGGLVVVERPHLMQHLFDHMVDGGCSFAGRVEHSGDLGIGSMGERDR